MFRPTTAFYLKRLFGADPDSWRRAAAAIRSHELHDTVLGDGCLTVSARSRLAAIVLSGVLALGVSATAAAESLKIGFVNPSKVSSGAPQADAARRKLEKEFAPRDQDIVAMQDKLQTLEKRMREQGASLDEAEKQDLQRDMVSLRRDIKRTQDAFREDFNMRRNEELGELQRRILKTVSEYAREHDYDLVVSDGVIYASDGVNITDRIIERLRSEFERNQKSR